MKDTTYLPGPELLPRIAPTENDPWRGHVLRGEVHDENAAALGGIAPHAGLFGTAPDLARFAQMLLNGGVFEQQRIVSRETVERFTQAPGRARTPAARSAGTRPSENSSAGSLFGPRSFGHTGFTGTSMWMDPERNLFVILLTNRVHPTRENNAIREVPARRGRRGGAGPRPTMNIRVRREPAWMAAALSRSGAAAETRSDPSRRAGTRPAGRRQPKPKACATPPCRSRSAWSRSRPRRAGRSRARRSASSPTRRPSPPTAGARSTCCAWPASTWSKLFAPEHGAQGKAAAGEKVGDTQDPIARVPIVSLYGEKTKPTPEDLKGLDALVFDLQDGGVRFYTYVSTMILGLEAAADAGIEFVVLDRPNPLGGERVEGPDSDPRDAVPESLVNTAPGPARPRADRGRDGAVRERARWPSPRASPSCP